MGTIAEQKVYAQATVQKTMPTVDRDALRNALDAYDRGETVKAEPVLHDLATRYPANYEANEAVGSLYAEAGDMQRALPYLEAACRLSPRQPVAHANLGAAYLKLNRLPDSLRELQLAAKTDPGNRETQSNLGQALMLSGKPREAASAFAVASRAKPDDWGLRYNWALALYDAGSLKQAAEVLRPIPAQARTDQMHSLAGDIDEKLGNYKDAATSYQQAAQLNPSDANIYALTAELLRHWTWNEAIQIAQYGERQYPASSHFKVAEGIALYGSSQYPAASSAFAALLAAEPDNAVYADLLGRSCSLVAEGISAECNGLEDFARHHPQNAEAATYAATALLHRPAGQQDTAKAEQFLQQAIAADPKLAEAYFQFGVLDQMKLNWQASAAMLEKAIALRPTYPEAHYRLSRAYAHMGRRDDAQHEIALQQQYSQQEKDRLNTRMQEVVTFLLKPS